MLSSPQLASSRPPDGASSQRPRLSRHVQIAHTASTARYMGPVLPVRQPWPGELPGVLAALATEQSFADASLPGHSRWESHRFEQWFPVRAELVCEIAFNRSPGGSCAMGRAS